MVHVLARHLEQTEMSAQKVVIQSYHHDHDQRNAGLTGRALPEWQLSAVRIAHSVREPTLEHDEWQAMRMQ